METVVTVQLNVESLGDSRNALWKTPSVQNKICCFGSDTLCSDLPNPGRGEYLVEEWVLGLELCA